MKTALSIASSDSSNGAGATLDLRVFNYFKIYGFISLVTITSQNSKGVNKIFKVPPHIIESQIDTIVKDFPVDACKIGMLYSHQAIHTVAQRIKRRNFKNIILDTPQISKNGKNIITEQGFKALKKTLLPLADLITPNTDETYTLCNTEVRNVETAKEAAKIIFQMGVKNVLIKGGHLDTPTDIFFDGKDFYDFQGEKYTDKSAHGTGCALSAAICANLALGNSMLNSIAVSKDFLNEIIKKSQKMGKGAMDFLIIQ